MPIFLGIDGGGTQTSCLIGDEQSVLGSGSGGSSNLVRASESIARASLAAAIEQACAAANVSPSAIEKTCIGVAGAARPQVSSVIRQILGEIISGEIQIVGDMIIALEAAFGAGPGVVVIAGTGSIAYGRDPAGRTARAGGWGFTISDEGSGIWIGRSAVAATLRARDRGEQPSLLEHLTKAWDISSADELVMAANTTAPDFARLVPVILSAADAGNAIANAVLNQAGIELATLADIVIRRLFQDAAVIPVAMSGGVFRNSALVRRVFYNELRSLHPQASVNGPVIEPVFGALEMARKMAPPSPRS